MSFCLETVFIKPEKDVQIKSAIILLHGYGGDGKDISMLTLNWKRFLNNTIFLCPNGHQRCSINPSGYQWFDLSIDDEKYITDEAVKAEIILNKFIEQVKKNYNIWPFDNFKNNKKSVIVEIFPTLYFRKYSIKPKKNTGYTLNQINDALKKYNCLPVSKNFKMFGPDQDEADAIISVAALKYFSQNKKYWKVHKAAKKEGWIYGVKFINDKV